MRLTTIALAGVAIAACSHASAQATLTSTFRQNEVVAEANNGATGPIVDSGMESSTSQAGFTSDITAAALGLQGSSHGTARQVSGITPSCITMDAFTTSSASAPSLEPGAGASSRGVATLEVEFTLNAPARLSNVGTLRSNGDGGVVPSVVLFDSLGTVWYDAASNPGAYPIERSERFDAGDYRLLAEFSASAFATKFFTLSGSSSGDFAFKIEPLLGASYCPAAPHTQGFQATLDATGSEFLADNDLTLTVEDAIPGTTGIFIGGTGNAQAPLGGGTLCVSRSLFRLGPPVMADSVGHFAQTIDLAASAAPFAAGSTWYFQAWFRDVGAPGGANLSDAVELTWH